MQASGNSTSNTPHELTIQCPWRCWAPGCLSRRTCSMFYRITGLYSRVTLYFQDVIGAFFFFMVGRKTAYSKICPMAGGFLRQSFPKGDICPHRPTLPSRLISLCVALSTFSKWLPFLLPVFPCWDTRVWEPCLSYAFPLTRNTGLGIEQTLHKIFLEWHLITDI